MSWTSIEFAFVPPHVCQYLQCKRSDSDAFKLLSSSNNYILLQL